MNNLNSTLLEGQLLREPEVEERDGERVYLITLESNRYSRDKDGHIEKETGFFDVEITESDLIEKTRLQKGCKGRGARIVGRLRQDRWEDDAGRPCSRIVIVAEHIQFRAGK